MNLVSPAVSASSENKGYTLEPEGSAFKLVLGTKPVPQLKSGEVLIRMEAASLNFRDLLVAKRITTGGLTPLSDGAGVVEAVSDGGTRWSVGDRVMPAFFREWVDGRFQAGYHATALGGGEVDGVLQRYVAMPAKTLVAVPDALTSEQAATLPCAGVTAWSALVERGHLQAGEIVLVQGTGGVALFGLQIANAIGARVIVTSSSDEKLQRARDLGAWATINYTSTPGWDEEVMKLTDGAGADHILETGGQGTFDRSIRSVAAGGHIAQIGGLAGFGPTSNTMRLQLMNAELHGINVGSAQYLAALTNFIVEHRIEPVIDRVLGFDDAAEAYAVLEAARHFGKVVVRI